MKVVTPEIFKSLDKSEQSEVILRKDATLEVESEDQDSRQITFVISSSAVDRDGDTVSVNGWNFDNFRKNPIVLFDHDKSTLPIAKVINNGPTIEDNKVKATIEFVPSDIPEIGPKAESIYQLCRQGFLSATSVGFIVRECVLSDREQIGRRPGVDITSSELIELSIVTVPSNPEALIDNRSVSEDVVVSKSIDYSKMQERRKRKLKVYNFIYGRN